MISGDSTSSTILVEDAATYNTRTGGSLTAGHVAVSVDGALAADIVNVENLTINTGTAGDTINFSGDFSGTDLSTSGITVNTNTGLDTIDFSGITSAHTVNFVNSTGNENITAGADDNTFSYTTGDGTDTISAGSGTDTVTISTDGSDTVLIEDAATYNTRTGGSMTAGHIAVTINGTLALDLNEVENITLNTSNQDNITINGDFSATDLATNGLTINGSSGNETIDTSGITSSHAVDINTGAGTNTITLGSSAEDVDGAGTDSISYVNSTAGVNLDFSTNTYSGGDAQGDSLTNIESVTGSNQADVITTSSSGMTITAGGDDDTITGNTGQDSIIYHVGDGYDIIDGAGETDTFTLNGDNASSSTILVEDAATYNTRTGSSMTAGHVAISIDGVLSADLVNIENLIINTGTSGDTVNFSGDFSGTDLSTNGITINGTSAVDTVDASGITSSHSVYTLREESRIKGYPSTKR